MAGNVAEHAIAKSGSRYGGARQRDRGFADELPMGPGGGASDRKGDTASTRNDLPPLSEVALASTKYPSPLTASPSLTRSGKQSLTLYRRASGSGGPLAAAPCEAG